MINGARFSSLRGQILTKTLVVGLVPLAALAGVAVLGLNGLTSAGDRQIADSRRILIEESVTGRLRSEAETTGREIDLILQERIGDVEAWAYQPAIIEGATVGALVSDQRGLTGADPGVVEADLAGTKGLSSAPAADAFLSTELARLPEFRDVLFTDRNGYTTGWAASIEDYDQHDETWWQRAWEAGSHVGQVRAHAAGGDIVPIAVRIDNDRGTPVGVIRASLDADFVRAIADTRMVDGIEITVVTGNRRLLAETSSGHDRSRLGTDDLSFDELSSGIAEALVTETGSSADEAAFHGFAPVQRAFEPSETGEGGGGAVWHVVASQEADTALAPLAGLAALNDDLDRATVELITVVAIVVLFAAMVAMFTALSLSRRIVNPILTLTRRAERAAHNDLPNAVATLSAADANSDDDATRADLAIAADSELGKLADAFNSVQDTAVRLARGQAQQRRETTEMVANLGRRTQSLVKRQIRVIDELEQSEEQPDRLEALFTLDHLATRMRRNSESLLVIAGQRSSQRRSAPARMELVVQRAMGEVEEYERIEMGRIEPVALLGQAVTDTAHVLAELLDNALAFSPPETPVVITGMRARGQYLLSIIDRGIGLSAEELTATNSRLADGAALDVGTSKQLGLLVVAKLAARHKIGIRLREADNGGTVALVEIPPDLIQPAERASSFDRRQARGNDRLAAGGNRSQSASARKQASTGPAGEEAAGPKSRPAQRAVLDPDRTSPTSPRPATASDDQAEPSDPRDEAPDTRAEISDARIEDIDGAEQRSDDRAIPTGDESLPPLPHGAGHPPPVPARRRDDPPVPADQAHHPAMASPDQPRSPAVPAPPFPPADHPADAMAPHRRSADSGPRRRTTDPEPRRRTTDAPAVRPGASAGPAGPAGPAEGGGDDQVVQRVSRRPASRIRPLTEKVTAKRAVVTTTSADEVDDEAQEVRARWASFQHGRRRANDDSDDE